MLKNSKIDIFPLQEQNYQPWLTLWQQYLEFYEEKLPAQITQKSWQRLMDTDFPYYGLGAHQNLGNRGNAELQGFVHFTYHPSSWSPSDYCYIEDIFVSPTCRKQGVARQLMSAVYQKARDHGSDKVYWITETKNTAAQKLYHQIAEAVDYMRFESDL